jgi:hypothetical protein
MRLHIGFRPLRLRRLKVARGQFVLAATAQNVKQQVEPLLRPNYVYSQNIVITTIASIRVLGGNRAGRRPHGRFSASSDQTVAASSTLGTLRFFQTGGTSVAFDANAREAENCPHS